MPFGSSNEPLLTPTSNFTRNDSSSCLRRKERFSRRASSLKASAQSMEFIRFSISSGESPAAYRPPTMAPMLVPAIASTGIRNLSSSRSTPICAAPRAPPPPSTSPIRGHSASSCIAAFPDNAHSDNNPSTPSCRALHFIAAPSWSASPANPDYNGTLTPARRFEPAAHEQR